MPKVMKGSMSSDRFNKDFFEAVQGVMNVKSAKKLEETGLPLEEILGKDVPVPSRKLSTGEKIILTEIRKLTELDVSRTARVQAEIDGLLSRLDELRETREQIRHLKEDLRDLVGREEE